MNCPYCGTAEQNADAYCRRCGEWLSSHGVRHSGGRGSPTGRLSVMLVFNALSAVFALVSVVTLWTTYLGRAEAKWSIYIAGALCIVIAVHQAISFAFALKLKLRLSRGLVRPGADGGAAPRQPVRVLESRSAEEIIELPSVTEGTTELLPRRADTNRALDTPSARSSQTPSN